jgi:TPR repeat protein
MTPFRLLAMATMAVAFPFASMAETESPTIVLEEAGALCDKLAGHADDPDFAGVAVSFDDIDAATAEPACRQAIADHPDERRFLFQLARVLRKKGDPAAALSYYRQAADRGSTAALVGIGLMHEDGDGIAQDYLKAADHYRQAMDAGSTVAIGNLAYLYDRGELGGNGPGEALKLYERQIAAGDNYGLIDLGNLYLWGRGAEKNESKAEELFRRAIADGDVDIAASGKNMLAWMWATTNRNLVEAEALASAAVEYDPEEPAFLDTLAWVKHRLGRDAEAVLDAEKAVELEPDDAGYLNRLGDIRAALSEMDKAKAAWRRALEAPAPNPQDEPDWDAAAVRGKLDGAN